MIDICKCLFHLDDSFLRILNYRSVRVRDRRGLRINSDIRKSGSGGGGSGGGGSGGGSSGGGGSGGDGGGNYAVSLSQHRLFISEFLKNYRRIVWH